MVAVRPLPSLPPEPLPPSRLHTAVAYLVTFYPRQTITPALVAGYVAELADLPIEAVEEAVRVIVRTAPFWPSVSEIRATVAEIALALPDEAEALTAVEMYVQAVAGRRKLACPACTSGDWEATARCRECEGSGEVWDRAAPVLHATVKEALLLVGGVHAFQSTDEPSVLRGQFMRLFRAAHARALRAARVGEIEPGPLALPRGGERRAISGG